VEHRSHIDGNLWVGAFAPGVGVLDLREEFPDSIEQPVPADRVEGLAERAEVMLRSGPTLICCTAGINRSPLVAARVLMRQGRTADEAIALLRERRGDVVLCNPTFETWLRETTA
jgi:protein-tyrosine phosphatase